SQLERAGGPLGLQDDVRALRARRTGEAQSRRRLGGSDLDRWTAPLGDESEQYGLRLFLTRGGRAGRENGDAAAHPTMRVDDLERATSQDGQLLLGECRTEPLCETECQEREIQDHQGIETRPGAHTEILPHDGFQETTRDLNSLRSAADRTLSRDA